MFPFLFHDAFPSSATCQVSYLVAVCVCPFC